LNILENRKARFWSGPRALCILVSAKECSLARVLTVGEIWVEANGWVLLCCCCSYRMDL